MKTTVMSVEPMLLRAKSTDRYMISSLILSQRFRHKVRVWARWLWG